MENCQLDLLLEQPEVPSALLEVIPCGLYMVDRHGRICQWNTAAEAITGLDRSQAVGNPCGQVLPCPNQASVCPLLRAPGEVPHPNCTQITLETAGGMKQLYKNVRYLRDAEGRVTGAVESFVDLTREREAEAVLREARELVESARQAKRHFMANMSHEIRTPLNGIMGLLNLLLQENPAPRQKEHLLMARRSTDLLLNLVGDILDFTVIDKGSLQIEETGFSLRSVLASVIARQHDLTQNKEVYIHSHVAEDVPDNLLGDSGRVYQILKHLVGNAIKFTPAGEVAVSVCRYNTGNDSIQADHRRIRLLFSVSDTGVGIPQDKCRQLFDAFAQENDSSTRAFGGLGIGLHTVRRLIDLLGGSIRIESKFHGTGVHFELPFRRTYDNNSLPSHASDTETSPEKEDKTAPQSLSTPALMSESTVGVDLYKAAAPSDLLQLPPYEELHAMLQSDLPAAERLLSQTRGAAAAAGQKALAAALMRLLLAVRRNEPTAIERCWTQLEREQVPGVDLDCTDSSPGENHEDIDCRG